MCDFVIEDVTGDTNFSDNHKYFLASLYEKKREYEKSYKLVNELIEKDESNAHAWNFIGYSLLERGKDLNKAYKYIKAYRRCDFGYTVKPVLSSQLRE